MALTTICIDTREPPGIRRLAFGGVPKVITPLDYADSNGSYDALCLCDDSTMLACERATPNDFLRKLRDGRLFPQIEALRRVSPWAYLAITGEIRPGPNDRAWVTDDEGREQQTGWAWSAVQGAMVTVQEVGVAVVYCGSSLGYEKTIIQLAGRDHHTVRVPPARDIELLTDQEALLASLPGVGRERAAALLAYCRTPACALDWLTGRSREKVAGVGPGTRQRVRRALGLPEDEWLTVQTLCDPVTGEVLRVPEMETEEV